MTCEPGCPMNPWFTDPPPTPPEPDMGSKGDRDEPVKPKKRR